MPTEFATALAHVPWKSLLTVGSAGASLVRQSTWLAETWRGVTLRLGVGQDIVLAGPKGVGKTLLLDVLRGAAMQAGYERPPPSLEPDSAVTTLDQAVAITVVPGDRLQARDVALRTAVVNNANLRVLVLVVSAGLATIRDEAVRRDRLARGTTLNELRVRHHDDEIAELEELVGVLKLRPRGAPLRLLVAVNKADLWWPEADQVYRRYDPAGEGPFVDRLRELQDHLGKQALHVRTVPTVAWSEDYRWGDEALNVALRDEADRRALQRAFVEALG